MTPVLQEPVSITPALARRIEIWPVGRLVAYTRNARTHSDAQVAQIAASIAEFGFNTPILVDSSAGIVAGHGRLPGRFEVGSVGTSVDFRVNQHRPVESRPVPGVDLFC